MVLESWNDGAAKSAIVDFVARMTREFRLSPLVEVLDKASEYGIAPAGLQHDWNAVLADDAR